MSLLLHALSLALILHHEKPLKLGCATFFVGGPCNQLQTICWATDAHTNINRLSTTPTQVLTCCGLPQQANT